MTMVYKAWFGDLRGRILVKPHTTGMWYKAKPKAIMALTTESSHVYTIAVNTKVGLSRKIY